MRDAREIASEIVSRAQKQCSVNGIGMSMGCINHIRVGDVTAASALIDEIACAIETARRETTQING